MHVFWYCVFVCPLLFTFILSVFCTHWIVSLGFLAQIIAIGFILRTWIAPLVLRQVSDRVRIRSISPRSIRGLYVRAGNYTLHVGRVGLSYHRPSKKSARRFSIKVESFRIELHENLTAQKFSVQSRWAKRKTENDYGTSRIEYYVWMTFSVVYSLLDPYIRPVIRTFFVTLIRLLIRSLPALTQVLDLEVDSFVIVFQAFSGAYLSLIDITLYTQITFTQLEGVIDSEMHEPSSHRNRRNFLDMVHWKVRLTNSIGRVWNKAWGNAYGSASIVLKIGSISCLKGKSDIPIVLLKNIPDESRTGTEEDARSAQYSPFIDVTRSSDLTAAFSFSPKSGLIGRHSITMSLSVPQLDIALDDLMMLTCIFKRRNSVTIPAISSSSKTPSISASSTPRIIRHQSNLSQARSLYPSSNRFLSNLKSIEILLDSIVLRYRFGIESRPFETEFSSKVGALTFTAGLSNSDKNLLHRQHLGRSETSDVEVYAMNCSIASVTVDMIHRSSRHLTRIFSIGHIGFRSIVSQWPQNAMSHSCWSLGDPNSAFLALNLSVSGVKILMHWQLILYLLTRNSIHDMSSNSQKRNFGIFQFPRFIVESEITDIGVYLILSEGEAEDADIVCARSDSLVINSSSMFSWSHNAGNNLDLSEKEDALQCKAHLALTSVLEPVTMKITHAVIVDNMMDSLLIENLISDKERMNILTSSMIELDAHGEVFGCVVDGRDVTASFDLSTLVAELSCRLEALNIELWQPSVTASFVNVLRHSKEHYSNSKSSSSTNRLDYSTGLPFYLSAQFALPRLVIYMTSRELNPYDDLELYRGLAMRTGFCMEFSSPINKQKTTLNNVSYGRERARQNLSLQEDLTIHALATENAATLSNTIDVCMARLTLWNTVLRTTVATEYALDQDCDIDENKPEIKANEFFWTDNIQVYYSRLRQIDPGSTIRPVNRIVSLISYIRMSTKLLHAYCLLQTLRVILPIIAEKNGSIKDESNLENSVWIWTGTVGIFRMLLEYPLQSKMCIRINDSTLSKNGATFEGSWRNLVIWVPVNNGQEKWEELLRFEMWKIIHRKTIPQLCINLERTGIRLPYGFVPADLILDLNMTLKCLQHLKRSVFTGVYQAMEDPKPEPAKKITSVRLKISLLSLEAADDPLESKLALIWKTGVEVAKTRRERDEAFEVKVATISSAEKRNHDLEADVHGSYRFTAAHSVSVEEAHKRLLQVHSVSWVARHREAQSEQAKHEDNIQRQICKDQKHSVGLGTPFVDPISSTGTPPLIRIMLTDMDLTLDSPHFSHKGLADFLYDVGDGLPRSTLFTLLIPIHLGIAVSSTSIILRDYPLPLLNVPHPDSVKDNAWKLNTDLVIGEEVGNNSSVVWKRCFVIDDHDTKTVGGRTFTIDVPKTTMPVKFYANPSVLVTTDGITDFSWGVSYNSPLQDVMRVLDALSAPPADPSPAMGFWDKVCVVDVHSINPSNSRHIADETNSSLSSQNEFQESGSRDPYSLIGDGAGFSFCWDGKTQMTIGHANADNEFLQVDSDTMLIIIPNLRRFLHANEALPISQLSTDSKSINSNTARKICAKFDGGIRWGIGLEFEKTCTLSCSVCNGAGTCRLFKFPPHHSVVLMPKTMKPKEKTKDDSYKDFRSDYIHLSTSLTTYTAQSTRRLSSTYNSFHLTPKTFAHFWAWWSLFDSSLSLPIRQGSLFPQRRACPKKFGRHLATLKYRLSLSNLYISHVYIDDTRDSWSKGVTTCIGIKAFIDKFQADMHQREQETTIVTGQPARAKRIRHKPFYAAEVNLTGLNMRAMRSVFEDPLKQLALLSSSLPENSAFSSTKEPLPTDLSSPWVNLDDFVEVDWVPSGPPNTLHLIPIASCPHFTYLKHFNGRNPSMETSRFGSENTHVCLMGKGLKTQDAQRILVEARLKELEEEFSGLSDVFTNSQSAATQAEGMQHVAIIRYMIELLRHYIQKYHASTKTDVASHLGVEENQKYFLASGVSRPTDWVRFDNIYELHCPKVYVRNFTRDILVRYYICSRLRRGFEYHMATRAVKFIRDQADTIVARSNVNEKGKKGWTSAIGAANVLRKILTGDGDYEKTTPDSADSCTEKMEKLNPLSGWSEGVTLKRSHFVLLMKPQLILRSDVGESSVCILTALQATLQGFAVLDTSNAEDPISGRVMTRNYALLNGLQTFAPSATCRSKEDGVPLEVLLDLKCESSDFDRLVPQTDATLQYDKFNRLRLRNNVTSVSVSSSDETNSHIYNQTDLIDVRIPRFTLSADCKHFEAVSNIVTDLLLFSDASYRTHLNKVETLLFAYDFTNLASTANVVSGLQTRLRNIVELERAVTLECSQNGGMGNIDIFKLKANVFSLAEELNLIFDVIKLAQDRADGLYNDQKSALRLHASSSEISWKMLDDNHELIAKLAMKLINFSWLSRQDSSTVNTVDIVDLQAFDGAPETEWPEILCKYHETTSHSMVKRGIFLEADWTVLAPVGGITIYERFVLDFHPMRVQLDGRVGRNVMEYLWPAKRNRERGNISETSVADLPKMKPIATPTGKVLGQRSSLDSPRIIMPSLHHPGEDRSRSLRSKTLRNSRSFSDLRHMNKSGTSNRDIRTRWTPSSQSSEANLSRLSDADSSQEVKTESTSETIVIPGAGEHRSKNDAIEMRSRSSQKTFILVKMSSIHLLLSIRKEDSFYCRDARIRTRDLEYRNQTWSFEELADQFIPNDLTWRGWVRVAFQQPLLPVFPVARELISKTKWLTKSKTAKQGRRKSGTKLVRTSNRKTGNNVGKEEEEAVMDMKEEM